MLDYFEDNVRRGNLTPAVLAAALGACATETLLLNSERIDQQFGSYGIDELASEAGLRRSSLYSIQNGKRVCRTYAVVRFVDNPDSSYGQLHAKVLAGNSLGEIFKSNGWSIHKQTLHIGSFSPGPTDTEIDQLMLLDDNRSLALHVYQLLLERDTQAFEYATIVEAHHPDYLSESTLLDIYHYNNSGRLTDESVSELISLVSRRR